MSTNQVINNTAAPKQNEYHVASFVAHAMKDQVSAVKKSIEEVAGAEFHGVSPEDKIVFTIEGNSHRDIGKKIDLLKNHHGLISLLPVYHQYQSEKQAAKN